MQADQAIAAADQFLPHLQSLPKAVLFLPGLGLLTGLVMWLTGRRVVRPVFAIFGLLAGGVLGFFFLPMLGVEEIAKAPSPYIGLIIGAVGGLVAAILAFRFAMAVSTAAVAAIVASLGASVYLNYAAPMPGAADQTQAGLSADEQMLDGVTIAQPQEEEDPPETIQDEDSSVPDRDTTPDSQTAELEREPVDLTELALRSASARTQAFLKELWLEVSAAFSDLPPAHRLAISGSCLFGAVLGLLIGLVAPVRASAVVTAMLGAAVWLPSLAWLTHALKMPGQSVLDHGAMGWLVIWIVISLIGTIFQFTGLPGRKKQQDPEDE